MLHENNLQEFYYLQIKSKKISQILFPERLLFRSYTVFCLFYFIHLFIAALADFDIDVGNSRLIVGTT